MPTARPASRRHPLSVSSTKCDQHDRVHDGRRTAAVVSVGVAKVDENVGWWLKSTDN
jgi:hypothetical protein